MFAYLLYVIIVIAIGAVVYAAVVSKMVRTIALCVVAAIVVAAILPVVGHAEKVCSDDVRTCWIISFDLGNGFVWVEDEDGFQFPVPFARDNYQLGEERTLWVYEFLPCWLEPTI